MTTDIQADAQRLATPILAGVLGVVVFVAAAVAGNIGAASFVGATIVLRHRS